MNHAQGDLQSELLADYLRYHAGCLQRTAGIMATQGLAILERGDQRGESMVETAHDIGVFARGCISDAMAAEGKECPPASWVDPGPDRGGAQWEEMS